MAIAACIGTVRAMADPPSEAKVTKLVTNIPTVQNPTLKIRVDYIVEDGKGVTI